MEPYVIAVVARSVERIIAVLFGGLAVYYGFRLFLVVPVETRGDGKIQLPGVSVVLSKAGPGLFFAAFGVIVIGMSLTSPVKYEGDHVTYQGIAATAPDAGPNRAAVQSQQAASAQQVARVRLAIQTLNCLLAASAAHPASIPADDVDLAIRDAKLALLAGVWNAAEWGDPEKFRRWAAAGEGSTASPARAVFTATRSDCPG